MQGMGMEELLSFRAGIMNATHQENKKFRVEPDPRSGRLVLARTPDGAIHLFWKVRNSEQPEEDLLVFPENQDFTKVNTGREEDRVYLLQFRGSSKRFFFWMQEPNKSVDEENCRKLNSYMNNPPPPNSGGGQMGDAEFDQQALMQLLSQFQGSAGMDNFSSMFGGSAEGGSNSGRSNGQGSGRSNSSSESKDDEEKSNERGGDEGKDNDQATTATSSSGGQQPNLTQEDFQRALTGMQSMMQQMQQQQRMTPALDKVYDSSTMQELLSDAELRRHLIQFLPDEQQTDEELYNVISSPQVRQAMLALSHALQSSNFNAIMANFQLDPMDGAADLERGDGIGAFLRALQARVDRESGDNDEEFYK